jgi:hypothetical protein
MHFSAEELRETYAKLSNNKLIQIATQESGSLRPEALDILKEELHKRKLSDEYMTAVDIQQVVLTEEKKQFYYALIQTLPCPMCGSTSKQLNMALVSRVYSFIILTSYIKKPIIGCEDCLHSKLNNATTSTLLHPLFEEFITKNIGLIEIYKNEPLKLRQLIRSVNDSE